MHIWVLWLGPNANICEWQVTARTSWVQLRSSRELFGVLVWRKHGRSSLCLFEVEVPSGTSRKAVLSISGSLPEAYPGISKTRLSQGHDTQWHIQVLRCRGQSLEVRRTAVNDLPCPPPKSAPTITFTGTDSTPNTAQTSKTHLGPLKGERDWRLRVDLEKWLWFPIEVTWQSAALTYTCDLVILPSHCLCCRVHWGSLQIQNPQLCWANSKQIYPVDGAHLMTPVKPLYLLDTQHGMKPLCLKRFLTFHSIQVSAFQQEDAFIEGNWS